MSRIRSEHEPPRRHRAITASEKLTAFYRSGDESGETPPDNGEVVAGLRPLKELLEEKE